MNILITAIALMLASEPAAPKKEDPKPEKLEAFNGRYWRLVARQLAAGVKRTDAIAAVTKQADREHEDEMAAIAADFRRLTEEARAASGCKVATGKDGLECTK